MAEASATKTAGTAPVHFLLRRLHSLTGIVPIGVFLIAHLVTNSSLLWGGAAMRGETYPGVETLQDGGTAYFHKEVVWINEEIPHLLLIEITLWVSIAFHSILGIYYAMSGKSNIGRYGYGGNFRYTLQRWSGYFGILFIFYHVATLRWGWDFLIPGGASWSHHHSASTLALALRGGQDITAAGLGVSLFYFFGVTMLVYHFANGLWTAAISWGLTVSERAQKQWGFACAGIGAGLMVAAWASVVSAVMLDPTQARLVEDVVNAKKAGTLDDQEARVPAPTLEPVGVGTARSEP